MLDSIKKYVQVFDNLDDANNFLSKTVDGTPTKKSNDESKDAIIAALADDVSATNENNDVNKVTVQLINIKL
jgi:hypothetical protein